VHKAICNGEYLVTIWFQGRRLPPWSIVMDVATTNPILKSTDIVTPDSETALWWWHFNSCVGIITKAKSVVIEHHAKLLRAQLECKAQEFQTHLEYFADPQIVFGDAGREWSADRPREVFDDWLQAIDMIREEAAKAPECVWYGGYEGTGPFLSDPSMAPPWPPPRMGEVAVRDLTDLGRDESTRFDLDLDAAS
jgi:hypothetical protein